MVLQQLLQKDKWSSNKQVQANNMVGWDMVDMLLWTSRILSLVIYPNGYLWVTISLKLVYYILVNLAVHLLPLKLTHLQHLHLLKVNLAILHLNQVIVSLKKPMLTHLNMKILIVHQLLNQSITQNQQPHRHLTFHLKSQLNQLTQHLCQVMDNQVCFKTLMNQSLLCLPIPQPNQPTSLPIPQPHQLTRHLPNLPTVSVHLPVTNHSLYSTPHHKPAMVLNQFNSMPNQNQSNHLTQQYLAQATTQTSTHCQVLLARPT